MRGLEFRGLNFLPVLLSGKLSYDYGMSYDIMLYYSAKKNGKYQFCMESFQDEVVISDMKGIKQGKTYYFKARFCDTKSGKGEVFYGNFCKPLAVKIK